MQALWAPRSQTLAQRLWPDAGDQVAIFRPRHATSQGPGKFGRLRIRKGRCGDPEAYGRRWGYRRIGSYDHEHVFIENLDNLIIAKLCLVFVNNTIAWNIRQHGTVVKANLSLSKWSETL